MSNNVIKESSMSFSLDCVVGVSDVALVMAFYLGSVQDISACGAVSKMYSYLFVQRKYHGKSLVNKIIHKNFVSRLETFFPTRSSQYVALSFCRFLSRYDYCFSGSGVLAAMTGIGVGDNTWEWGIPLRNIDVYIREKPVVFIESLEVWIRNMGEYFEMEMCSFEI